VLMPVAPGIGAGWTIERRTAADSPDGRAERSTGWRAAACPFATGRYRTAARAGHRCAGRALDAAWAAVSRRSGAPSTRGIYLVIDNIQALGRPFRFGRRAIRTRSSCECA